MPTKRSAGLLLYRRRGDRVEVLLAHPGGPFFASRELGTWTVPKGEIEDGEEPHDVARREFREETGHEPPDGRRVDLGEIRQKGGKVVRAWAVEGDLQPGAATSNTFRLEWPRGSGRFIDAPEIDRVEWFAPEEARLRMKDTQVPFIDRLLASLTAPAGLPDTRD
jgi:predicted NUDIX family NTP pyrophosphohydrolase